MSLFSELKRRNVFRVRIAYVVTAWVLAQVLQLVLESFAAPDWVMQTLLVVLAAGLPLVLVVAWAYELTPEGLKREQDVERAASITGRTGRKLDRVIIAVLALAVGLLLADRFLLERGDETGVISGDATPIVAVLPFKATGPGRLEERPDVGDL